MLSRARIHAPLASANVAKYGTSLPAIQTSGTTDRRLSGHHSFCVFFARIMQPIFWSDSETNIDTFKSPQVSFFETQDARKCRFCNLKLWNRFHARCEGLSLIGFLPGHLEESPRHQGWGYGDANSRIRDTQVLECERTIAASASSTSSLFGG